MAVGDRSWGEAPDVRVSDSDRDETANLLRRHVSDGRLTMEEFSERLAEVYDARTRSDLQRTLRDLPDLNERKVPARPSSDPERERRIHRFRRNLSGWFTPNFICIGIWAVTSPHGYFWPIWVLIPTTVGFVGHELAGETKDDKRKNRQREMKAKFEKQIERHIEEAISGGVGREHAARPPRQRQHERVDTPTRTVTTVLFADIVDSTQRAASLGDAGWRKLLDQHESLVNRELDRWGGRKVFTKGDEVVAAFDAPAQAVRCGVAIRDRARSLALEVRVGVHAGEVERRGDDVSGIALHIGQRVSSQAEPGQVLVTSTVKELTTGSGIRFEDKGERELKGVAEPWRLYAVD
jgi:class 3 adenylate cyclase